MELKIAPISLPMLMQYGLLRHARGRRDLVVAPKAAVFVVEPAGVLVAAVALEPERGMIFAEDLITNGTVPARVRYAAIGFVVRTVMMVGTAMNMPVVAVPESNGLRKLLLRHGWTAREDQAALVREPGVVVTYQPARGNTRPPAHAEPPPVPKKPLPKKRGRK